MRHTRRYPPPAHTYHYDETNGLDTNRGTVDSPLKTIGNLNSRTLKPGDRVLFSRGITFNDADLVVPSSGDRRRPILFADYGQTGSARPILQAQTTNAILANQRENLIFKNLDCDANNLTFAAKLYCSHLVVDNCRFRGASGTAPGEGGVGGVGIQIEDNGTLKHDIYILNCELNNNSGYGGMTTDPTTYAIRTLIRDCYVHDNGTDATFHHGIYLRGWRDVTVENTRCINNSNGGIVIADGDGFTIDRCTLNDNGTGGSCYNSPSGTGRQIYRNNEIYSNNVKGINLNGYSGFYEFYNNTIVNNVIGIHFRSGVTGSIMKNNNLCEFISGQVLYIESLANAQTHVSDNNNFRKTTGSKPINIASTFYSLAEWQALSNSPDPNGISANPTFVTDYTNLHLQSGSVCRNAGVTVSGVETDHDYVLLDASPDIGAYQYV